MERGDTYSVKELKNAGFYHFKQRSDYPQIFVKNRAVYFFENHPENNKLRLIDISDHR